MSKIDYTVCIGHGPCADGQTALGIAWMEQPQEVRDYLAQYGGLYSKQKRRYEAKYQNPHHPDQALRILKEWKLPDYAPVVFVFTQPNTRYPEELLRGRRVLCIDLDPGIIGIKQLMSLTTYTLVLDHHDSFKTSMSLLGVDIPEQTLSRVSDNFHFYWNPAKTVSGATLAWQFLKPSARTFPHLIEIVQIGDTWNWKQRPEIKVKECLEALHARNVFSSFEDIVEYINNFRNQYQSLVNEGGPILKVKDKFVDSIALKANFGYIITPEPGDRMMIYNVLYTSSTVMELEIGDRIRELSVEWYKKEKGIDIDFTAVWKYVPSKPEVVRRPGEMPRPGYVTVSLRGGAPGINLLDIARRIPGIKSCTGYDKAAAFTFEGIDNFEQFIHSDLRKNDELPMPVAVIPTNTGPLPSPVIQQQQIIPPQQVLQPQLQPQQPQQLAQQAPVPPLPMPTIQQALPIETPVTIPKSGQSAPPQQQFTPSQVETQVGPSNSSLGILTQIGQSSRSGDTSQLSQIGSTSRRGTINYDDGPSQPIQRDLGSRNVVPTQPFVSPPAPTPQVDTMKIAQAYAAMKATQLSATPAPTPQPPAPQPQPQPSVPVPRPQPQPQPPASVPQPPAPALPSAAVPAPISVPQPSVPAPQPSISINTT